MLTSEDRAQLRQYGMTVEQVEAHLQLFHDGLPFMTLLRPCTIGDGITQLSDQELQQYSRTFDEAVSAGLATKFVPASGAASRMFKSLMTCLEHFRRDGPPADPHRTLEPPDAQALEQFLQGLPRLAFYDDLQKSLAGAGLSCAELVAQKQAGPILEHLLTSTGLGYASLPKGLIPFHHSPHGPRTPLAEHLIEAAAYTKDAQRQARLHVTVSPEHLPLFQRHYEAIRGRYEQATDTVFRLSWSVQAAATNTIAVDLENRPFRDRDGRLVFRPGGHGALLGNLNALDDEIIFIKNIDNVVPEHLLEETRRYKRALGGYLVSLTRRIHAALAALAAGRMEAGEFETLAHFAFTQLAVFQPPDWTAWNHAQQRDFLFHALHRPIRVCGMVLNTGDPGGGPFWVEHEDHTYSRQIVEASQVDPHSPAQQALFKSATHFNPVDMVCAIKDYQGNRFDLHQFADPRTGFISQKSYEGRPLKALELPGLWNGGMAHWITVFIEVPKTTFNPVKTVNDLLHPQHQPDEPNRKE